MIGMWSAYSQQYMLAFAGITTLAFALPIFFTPVAWARHMRWTIPEHTDLAVYFGRCLGALIIVAEVFALRAALTGSGLVAAFEIMTAIVILMIPVHIYGAFRRIQPITETLEIGLWCALLVLNLSFFPMAGA
ncbi:MAG TPA: hypothetical protein VGE72_21270 [Azospirillum sp.]